MNIASTKMVLHEKLLSKNHGGAENNQIHKYINNISCALVSLPHFRGLFSNNYSGNISIELFSVNSKNENNRMVDICDKKKSSWTVLEPERFTLFALPFKIAPESGANRSTSDYPADKQKVQFKNIHEYQWSGPNVNFERCSGMLSTPDSIGPLKLSLKRIQIYSGQFLIKPHMFFD